tara:strand:+ start:4464 stop:5252 length:789 start_codon:yes stop_codon:yes gene_type:complete
MKLSLIIPVYNSSQILDELYKRIIRTLEEINLNTNYEIFFINDCSLDASWQVIKRIASTDGNVKGINLKRNFGQHNAIMAGFNYCKGENIITIDDDLQHPPESFGKILKKLKEHDVCYTHYRNRKHSTWKKNVSKLNNLISSFLLDKPISIYMSSFRGLKKKIVSEIVKSQSSNIYIDGKIINLTKNIGMITIDHSARKIGKSNYNLRKLLKLWSNMLIDFSFLPFRKASILGIILKFFIVLVRDKDNKVQFEVLDKLNIKK